MSENKDRRIVVEIFSHEAEQRLRAEMQRMEERHAAEVQQLERKLSGLHNTVYEVIDIIGTLRKKR